MPPLRRAPAKLGQAGRSGVRSVSWVKGLCVLGGCWLAGMGHCGREATRPYRGNVAEWRCRLSLALIQSRRGRFGPSTLRFHHLTLQALPLQSHLRLGVEAKVKAAGAARKWLVCLGLQQFGAWKEQFATRTVPRRRTNYFVTRCMLRLLH